RTSPANTKRAASNPPSACGTPAPHVMYRHGRADLRLDIDGLQGSQAPGRIDELSRAVHLAWFRRACQRVMPPAGAVIFACGVRGMAQTTAWQVSQRSRSGCTTSAPRRGNLRGKGDACLGRLASSLNSVDTDRTGR